MKASRLLHPIAGHIAVVPAETAHRVRRFLLLSVLTCVTLYRSAAAQGEWDHLFTLPGLNHYAPALAVDNAGNVYAGGTFTTAGGRPANGVAMFDGDKWNPLGSGIGGNGWFSANVIAVDQSGTVFVGGSFSQAGGVAVGNIASWTGGSWLGMGGGVNGEVRAIAVDSHGDVVVGGSFTSAGGQTVENIAKWNGSTWSAVGSGTNGAVHELAFDSGDNLYAVGGFDSAGGVSVNHLARWNGSEWQDVGSPLNFSGQALTVDSFDNVYAADQTTVYKYDGSTWVQQGHSFNNMPDALVVDNAGKLYVGGGFNSGYGDPVDGIARLDGSTWVQLGKGMSWVLALAKDAAGNIYVTNDSPSLEGSNGIRFGYIARWDGTAFSGVGPGAAGPWPIQDLVVNDNRDLYVGGSFKYAGFVPAKYVAKWDGQDWNAFGPGPKGPVNAVALGSNGSLYAAGSFDPGGSSASEGFVSQWSGSNWTELAVETGNVAGGSVVNDIQVGEGATIYAAGYFSTIDGAAANNIALWSGSAWSGLGQGLNNAAYAVIVDESGYVYVGGAFTAAGGQPAAHAAKWDGSAWSALGPGPGGEVRTLTFDSNGALFAGGGFGTARWDGSSWTILNSTAGKTSVTDVNALAADDYGRVYAGGHFSSLGGTTANNLALWNGTSWSALGAGTDGSVNALGVYGGKEVFVAGQFESVGGSESVGLGLWVAETVATLAPPTLLSPADGATGVSSTAVLKWTGLGPGIRYDVQVSVTGDFSSLVFTENLPEKETEFVAPMTDRTYFWRLRAVGNGMTSSWSGSRQFAVGTKGPLAVTLLLPADKATNQAKSLDFSWTSASEASGYHFQLSEKEDFSTGGINAPSLASTSFRATGLKGVTRYYWRVAGVDDQGRKTLSPTRSFTTVVDAPAMVTLLAPDDAAVHVPRLTSFSWNPQPGAGTYQLQVAIDDQFTKIVVNDSALTAASRALAGPLDHGTRYHWRVRGRNAGGNGAWSSTRSFTTIVASPGEIALMEPSDGAANVPVSPVFGWAESATALMYQLQVARDVSFGDVVVNDSALTTTTRTLTAPLNHGTGYYWRVRGRNAGGNGAWSEIRSFTTVVARPGEIALIEPSDDAKGVPISPVFTWAGFESALMYQLQVARDSTFGDVVVNDSALTDSRDSLSTALEPATDYYWRVRARNAGGDGPWSDVWSFRTAVAAPGAVALGAPEDGATGVPPFANLTWQTIDDVIGYHLQLSADPAFTAALVDDSTLTDPSWMAVDPLTYSTTLYWHVRAVRDDGLGKSTGVIYGPWSETRSFTVAVGTASESDASLPTEFALHQNYPNPFNPSTTIGYDLPEATSVHLVVFDVLGRQVVTLFAGDQQAGRYAHSWHADGVPSGVYIVSLDAGIFRSTRQVVLVE